MKGQLSVDPIFTSFGIYRATVFSKKPVVAVDHHRLYFVPPQQSKSNKIHSKSKQKSSQQIKSYQNDQQQNFIQNRSQFQFSSNKVKSIPWDTSKSIINSTYSYQYQTLFLLCDDWKLYIYNNNLEQIAKLVNWQSKYTVGFQFIEKLGILLMIGVSEVQILKMNVITNIKKTKFLSSVKFGIQKVSIIRQDPKTKLKWNKGYGYDLENNLLFLWSLQDINFYSLNKLQLKSEIRNVVKKQEPITYTYFNSSYKYTVTGLLNGNVRVWRLPLVMTSTHLSKSKTNKTLLSQNFSSSQNQYIMIHNCLYHTKQIQKIVAGNDDRVIVSQSADLTVCLWSLETFQLLRVYNFQGQYQKIMLNDFYGALAVKDNFLGELKFGKTMEFVMELANKIISHDKKYQKVLKIGHNSFIQNPIKQTQFTLSSNMGIQFQNGLFPITKDLNKLDPQFFYPPLKSQQIKQIISCPFASNQYFLLTEIGKIYRVRMQGFSSVIQYYYSINLTHDIQNHPLGQMPTLIKFLYIVPSQFDSQIIQSAIIDNANDSSANNNQEISPRLSRRQSQLYNLKNTHQTFQSLKLIAVGCNKGSIVFLPIDNMDHIYTRITYHRQEITMIETVYREEIKNSMLISVCKQNYMKFVQFDLVNKKAHCFRSLNLGKDNLSFIRGFEDRLAVVLYGGLFEVMKIGKINQNVNKKPDLKKQVSVNSNTSSLTKKQKQNPLFSLQLFSYINYQTFNHENDIVSLDIELQKQILLTGAKDNKIKIWTYYKIQLYEIHLDQGLKYAIFSNDYEIIVSHGQKILYLRDIPFRVTKEEINEINQSFLKEIGVDLNQNEGQTQNKRNEKSAPNILTLQKFLSNKQNSNGAKSLSNKKNYQALFITPGSQILNSPNQANQQSLNSAKLKPRQSLTIVSKQLFINTNDKQISKQKLQFDKSNSGRKYDHSHNQGNKFGTQLSIKLSKIEQQHQIQAKQGQKYNNPVLSTRKSFNSKQKTISIIQKKNSLPTNKKRSYSTARGRSSTKEIQYDVTNLTLIQQNNTNQAQHPQSHRQYDTHRSMSSKKYSGSHYSNQQQYSNNANDILILKKHLQDMQGLKKQILNPILPKIQAPKKRDQSSLLFDEFMKQKLMNKKVLTRRDITLNRIIMKNIVKQNIGQNVTGNVLGLRLQF